MAVRRAPLSESVESHRFFPQSEARLHISLTSLTEERRTCGDKENTNEQGSGFWQG
jgi:hypothetical protein